ncbi:hypothetical protein Q1695_007324 [Nippostrongylus brasiliensis]|nr:hypothetical protein Q1695_007324 [Nippostrongylus brasiliensis]
MPTSLAQRIDGFEEELFDDYSVYETATQCYRKYWNILNVENFFDMFPHIAGRCAPLFSEMNIYRFGDEDEWRYSMLPRAIKGERKCNAFAFIGLTHALAVETEIKRNLMFDCDFLGMNPNASDIAHDFAMEVGEFMRSRDLEAWNGLSERSLASHLSKVMELKASEKAVVAEHIFVNEIEDPYALLPKMIDTVGYVKYIVPCQLTIDLPLPTHFQLINLIDFVGNIIEKERYTILSAEKIDDTMRLYLFYHAHQKCNQRYGPDY